MKIVALILLILFAIWFIIDFVKAVNEEHKDNGYL